jgi:hypothetical protein
MRLVNCEEKTEFDGHHLGPTDVTAIPVPAGFELPEIPLVIKNYADAP